MNHKGFFFTLIIFLIVIYIMSSLSLWVKSAEAGEKRYSERFRNIALENALSQLSEEKVGKIFKKTAMYALYRLNEHAVAHPLKAGVSDETEYFNLAMANIIHNGTTKPEYFEDGTALTAGASLKEHVESMKKSLALAGIAVEDFKFNNFKITQTAPNILSYQAKFTIVFSAGAYSRLTRVYELSNQLDINGITDPANAREVRGKPGLESYSKQFFFYPAYDKPAKVTPIELQTASLGQGWFYGPIVAVRAANSIAPESRAQYILVGTYNDITNLLGETSWQQFGAYVITTLPTPGAVCPTDQSKRSESDTLNPIIYEGTSCAPRIGRESTEKPFLVIMDFSIASAPPCPASFYREGDRCMLFVSRFDNRDIQTNPLRKSQASAFIYNIESIRDFSICGYYTNNARSPSYIQRLLPRPFERSSRFGIESFVIGNPFGGNPYLGSGPQAPYPDRLSRLDRELFKREDGIRVRGLSGCKTREGCSDGTPSPTGHFRISQGNLDYIANSKLGCNEYASCDVR